MERNSSMQRMKKVQALAEPELDGERKPPPPSRNADEENG